MSKDCTFPLLYSFRRCPYAMRARLALKVSSIKVELREILLKSKPREMLSVSEKGTVPVLVTPNEGVLDESLDIMYWALGQSDPMNWLARGKLQDAQALIKLNDENFKPKLDKYKYSVRFPEKSENDYRLEGVFFLEELNSRLSNSKFLTSDSPTIADFAIFPFIRQFASVDKVWFENTGFNHLNKWLELQINSELFQAIMQKYVPWDNSQPPNVF